MARRGVLVLWLAALLFACSRSDYEYVTNRGDRVYFKVPDGWTLFETEQLAEGEELAPGTWLRGFDGGKPARSDNVFSIDAGAPRGYAEVIRLSGSQRDAVSFVVLRSTNFGTDETGEPIDPLEFAAENPGGPLQILAYEEVNTRGARGVHLRVAIGQGGERSIVDQTVLVDGDTRRRYVLSLGCTERCWDDHADELREVVESWRVEARS